MALALSRWRVLPGTQEEDRKTKKNLERRQRESVGGQEIWYYIFKVSSPFPFPPWESTFYSLHLFLPLHFVGYLNWHRLFSISQNYCLSKYYYFVFMQVFSMQIKKDFEKVEDFAFYLRTVVIYIHHSEHSL